MSKQAESDWTCECDLIFYSSLSFLWCGFLARFFRSHFLGHFLFHESSFSPSSSGVSRLWEKLGGLEEVSSRMCLVRRVKTMVRTWEIPRVDVSEWRKFTFNLGFFLCCWTSGWEEKQICLMSRACGVFSCEYVGMNVNYGLNKLWWY